MRFLKLVPLVSACAAAAVVVGAGSASSLPIAPQALTAQIERSVPITQVRDGGAVAAGVIGGLIVGGMIASQAPYYYDYPPPYYGYPAYGPYPYDPSVGYCMRRFRSYDPYSMTYLGRDGLRHPCP